MKYQKILNDFLGIENLNYGFCISRTIESKLEKYNQNDILNTLAFAPISYEDKEKIFKMIINQEVNILIMKNYLEEHYDKFFNIEISKKRILEKYMKSFFDWIIIVSKYYSQDLLSSVKFTKKNISTKNELFWFELIKFFYEKQNYKETLYLIGFVKNKTIRKESIFFNIIILYEVVALRDKFEYLKDEQKRKKLCMRVKQLKDFDYLKIVTMLECSLVSNSIESFLDTVLKYKEIIFQWNISSILNIFEITVYSKNAKAFEVINNILTQRDIHSYKGNEEFLIYEFLMAIYENNIFKVAMHKEKLEKEKYDFSHFEWYISMKFNLNNFGELV